MAGDTVKKAQAAAMARSKKGKNSQTQYMLWIGGAIGSIVLAVVVLLLNPDKGPSGTAVNDASIITHANRNAKTWQAAASRFFEGWTIGDVKMLEGVAISQMGGGVPPCQTPDVAVPESFDAREKWPVCFQNPIYSMGNCTASWAIAAVTSLSNRFCISDPDQYKDLMLSPQQLLSCDKSNRGCSGGDIDGAWNFIEREGLVSEVCFPYQGDSTVSCSDHCDKETPLKASSHCMMDGEAAIKKEIFANGPVVAPIFLVDDFLVYRGGLYKETPTSTQLTGRDRNRIVHAVKIVGWGSMNYKNYWLIENSWGEDWGEGGFAKIVRGGDVKTRDSIMIETFAVAGTPASGKIEDASADDDDDVDLDPVEENKDDDDV